MNTPATPPPPDKSKYIQEVGDILIETEGKQDTYQPHMVKMASSKYNERHNYSADWSSWGMAVFCSSSDFENYHRMLDKKYGYAAMKTEMLNRIDIGDSNPWFDRDDWKAIDHYAGESDTDNFIPLIRAIGNLIARLFKAN